MKEIIQIYRGKGFFHLKGNRVNTLFYIKKELHSIVFFGEYDTRWRCYIGKNIQFKLLKGNYQYHNLVKYGHIDTSKNLEKQFDDITNLLTNGRYELALTFISYHKTMLCEKQKHEYILEVKK